MNEEEFEQSTTGPDLEHRFDAPPIPAPESDTAAIPLPPVTPPMGGPAGGPDSSYALGALAGNPYLSPPPPSASPGPPTAAGLPYWPAPPAPAAAPTSSHPLRNAGIFVSVAAVVLAAGVGIGHAAWKPSTPTAAAAPSASGASNSPVGRAGSPFNSGGSENSGSSNSSGSSGPSDVSSIAAKVDPGLVDIDVSLGYQSEQAAGTGIVLTSSGEILTNNHVIDGATSISVTDVGNDKTYSASVVGYDRTRDVAVLQLHNASGLQTATIGNSANVSVGEDVVGIGNAGGTGGTPSAAGGTVTALRQSITASDEGDGTSEQLTGLIQTNADIQAGDSGGSLVNGSGQIIGMDTAASAGFSFQSPDQSQGTEGFAIPINTALSIAKQIESGNGPATVHVGATAFLGVEVQGSSSGNGFGAGFGGGSASSGAVVAGVVTSSPAQEAGLAQGDVITTVNGTTVVSPTALTTALTPYHPGNKVTIGWTDTSGNTQSATVQLTSGPPQ